MASRQKSTDKGETEMVYILPAFILIILVVGFVKGVPCFDSFVKGAKNGAMTIVRLVPALVGLIVAIGVFRAAGLVCSIL